MGGDLHCHTRLSDGSMGIDDIITLARNKGLDTISVTDHDCLAGTVRAKIIGERNGIKVVPGVELSAIDGETGRIIHILCYLPDFPDRLEGLCRNNTVARQRAGQFMMIKAAQRYPVTAEVMKKCASGSTNLYIQHIMHALMECGVTTAIHSEIFDELFSPESENNILTKPKFADIKEVLETVHAASGIAVLAHPVLSDCMDSLDRFVEYGIDGIEVWHPSADKENTAQLQAYAKKCKLLMTGGSDFHGMYNYTPISLGDFRTPKNQLAELLGYKARIKRQAKKAAMELAEKNAVPAEASV